MSNIPPIDLFNQIASNLGVGYVDLINKGQQKNWITAKRVIRYNLVNRYVFLPYQLEKDFAGYVGFSHATFDHDAKFIENAIEKKYEDYIDITTRVSIICNEIDAKQPGIKENIFESEEKLINLQ